MSYLPTNEEWNIICQALHTERKAITEIETLKTGMTNRSFRFCLDGSRYIMRSPGEGTDRLINRAQEAAVYDAIAGLHLSDDVIYIDPATGYKITRYIENARVCDPSSEGDLVQCMDRLRSFHEMGLTVDHAFDIYGKIEFYESLWNGAPSCYQDYAVIKEHVRALQEYIEAHVERRVLTHIDAVPDNFLFSEHDGEQEIRLIDWEYAGMQDPHVDVAMFCIYAMYERQQVDHLIDLYFRGNCPQEIRIKIYCYIAACGLLWSNWCEYKRHCGVEFGDYAHRQYQYAGEYYEIVRKELGRS